MGDKAQLSKPSPYQLRALVLDYLCHQCYTNTARAFARESTIRHLDADGDEIHLESMGNVALSEVRLKDLDLRENIRVHILCGRVDEATSMLNEHFPSVLSGPALDHPPPLSESPNLMSHGVDYIPSTSIDPAHLTLNLRILSFVEACRTIPLVYPPPANADADAPSTLAPSTELSPERQLALLSKAQKFHALINALPNPNDRTVFLKELNNVSGLLAYKVPETSSISRYLSQERREAVADQVNSAILYRSSRPAVSSLEFLTRHTTALWSFANQYGVKPHPGMPLPSSLVQHAESSSKSSDKENEVVPLFSLEKFLDSKT